MSDIKLFKLNKDTLDELECVAFTFERSLQKLIEVNMEAVFGIKFLKSEYATGKEHGGRIDSLGIDENYCPVIIEYKRSLNENVINQGLFYLDWLMDHKAEFELLAIKTLGKEYGDKIEWSIPRLLCIAGDFTRYDEHAVKQINRNIELIRYKKYGEDMFLFELVNSQTVTEYVDTNDKSSKKAQKYKTYGEFFEQADDGLKNLYHVVSDFIKNLGDDVQEKELKYYKAFKRIKNFVCLEIRPQTKCLLLYLRLDPEKVDFKTGLTRDVRGIGHYGTGDVEVKISNIDDFEQTKHLIIKSYEAS
jgi:predicted transport protein